MKKYQHACIGTIETTLNAGMILTILYPNFHMSLKDNRLLDALKVQLQIVGVDQDPRSLGATLHYQMAYRIQNHAIDLALPTTTDTLMIHVDSHQIPSYTHIPRQISTEELKKLLPTSWITNYKKLHQPQIVVQSLEPLSRTQKDGSIEITFQKKEEASNCFTTQYMMSSVIPTVANIQFFDSKGNLLYAFRSNTGHCSFFFLLKKEEENLQ